MPVLAGHASAAVAPRRRSAHSARPRMSTASHHPRIELIVSDVDGTLLNHKQELTPKVQDAVLKAAELGVPLVVATGKARGPWAQIVLPQLRLATPGVYLQGLLITGPNGEILYQLDLPADVIRDCVNMSKELGVTLTAYCNDRILCASTDAHTERLLFYKEPPPEAIGDMATLVGGPVAVQKLIFMAPQSGIDALRPGLEAMLAGRASITSALEGMVEVLPLGASKGAGVEWLLRHLGVEASCVMAMGDGENDVEMLQLAGLGVAMGNAGPKARAAANVVVSSNDEDGVAEAIERYVLAPRMAGAAAASGSQQ